MTPEEKLLWAIFGEKASDVRDTSLRVPPGGAGTIVEVRVFSRRGLEKDERARAIERAEIERLAKDRDDEQSILEGGYLSRMASLLVGQEVGAGPKDIATDTVLTAELLDGMRPHLVSQIAVKDDNVQKSIEAQNANFEQAIKSLDGRFF